ncbi:MAG: protein O-GlcNAc transferase [Synergistaceae bacterium]|nr:protein O-GlcNAc transferase [Synergistaceae bacterium]
MKKRSAAVWCFPVFFLVFGLFGAYAVHGGLREALLKAAAAPGDAAAHAELARAYNLNNEPGKAFLAARQSLDLMPGFPPAVLELAHASRMKGNHEEAVKLYEMYLSDDPVSVEALAGNSESLARLERWDESFASAMAAIREAPKRAEGYGALGRAYRIAGRFEEAVEVLRQGLVFRSDSVDILYDLGLCCVELGDRTSALVQYERLLELDPEKASFLFRTIYP